ncbi:hypothetical protein LTR62_002286 [Meristemomyces frigidus]|uniref:MFS general substrate transporter n=1 Tax=Meristemomyces frigidus TaxID=1508187 RepID=A0AAN7TMH7_9PEZI|nr:hypothetical protein LTR62_002286 [Meristemomyces frigidus]
MLLTIFTRHRSHSTTTLATSPSRMSSDPLNISMSEAPTNNASLGMESSETLGTRASKYSRRQSSENVQASASKESATVRTVHEDDELESGSAPISRTEQCWPREWRAYAALTACFMLMFNSWGLINSFGTYATYYHDPTTKTNPGQGFVRINSIGGMQIFLVLLFSCFVGRLTDANHHGLVLSVGTSLLAVALFAQASVAVHQPSENTTYAILMATQGILGGMGFSTFFVTSSQMAATWFRAKKPLTLGIVACGASVGGAVYSSTFKLVELAHGYKTATVAIGLIAISTSIVAVIFAKPPPSEKSPTLIWRFSTFWDKHAFQNAAYVWFAVGFGFICLGLYPSIFALEPWAFQKKLGFPGKVRPSELRKDTLATFALLSIFNGCSFLGRLLSGVSAQYADKHGSGALHIHIGVVATAVILVLGMWLVTATSACAEAYVVIYGAISGAVIGLPAATISHIIGNSNEVGQRKLGNWVGILYTIGSVPAMAGVLICGKLADAYMTTYTPVIVFCGVSYFLAACCMVIAAFKLGRRRVG